MGKGGFAVYSGDFTGGTKQVKISLSLSVYEHAASLVGRTPWEVSRNGNLILEAHRRAYRLYRYFPVVVGIDIYNLEAEAYGCKVQEPKGNGVPAITQPIFSSLDGGLKKIKPFNPNKAGRVPIIIKAGKRLQNEFPDADVRIPVSGPFSIAQNLLGLNQLMIDVAIYPDKVREFLYKLVEGQLIFIQAVVEIGLDVAFFESAAAPPLLSPKQFSEIELPPLKRVMHKAGEIVGHAVPCIIGGDTEPIIPEMLETGTDFLICPAETDRVAFLAKMKDHPEVKVRVNLDPKIYTYATKEKILSEVDKVIKLAAGRENILLGTGAIPYETSPENILLIKDYVS